MTNPYRNINELREWLKANSSGVYRPAAHAAAVIEEQESELITLRADNSELRAKLAAMESQEPVIRISGGRVVDFNPNYGGSVSEGEFYAKPVPADKPARITEQDVREIANNIFGYVGITYLTAAFENWFGKFGGRELLNRLNADREQVPAVAVPDNVGLIPMINGKPKVTGRMKVECIGEFSWREEAPYHDEDGDLHDYVATRVVPWDLCKEIYKRMASAALLASEPSHSQQSAKYAAFVEEVREARKLWMDMYPPEDGHDCVTPFDRFLYTDRCPSHESEQGKKSIDDLPGMWCESDLSGGWADSCNQQPEEVRGDHK